MMKKYNYFQSMDGHFRELAKVFIELKQEGIAYPAENYQRTLNSHFYLQNDMPKTYLDAMEFGYKKVLEFCS